MNWNILTQKELKTAGPKGLILLQQNETIFNYDIEEIKGEYGKILRKSIKEQVNNRITEENIKAIKKAINKRTKAERTKALNYEMGYISLLTEITLISRGYKKCN